ncbi:MAG: archaellin/type IV pilin N-terminal domain-containing protein [Candidatus Woesearchaeota archaeon]
MRTSAKSKAMNNNKKAEMGVGTLIIFIALLLVAAVAAGVLIQTAGSLQQQALTTGKATQSEISTNARVIEVSATNGSTQTISNFSMQMRLSPGSDPLKLEEVILTLNTDDETLTLQYSGNETYQTTGSAGTYGVRYLINGSNHVAGVLQRGDVIQVDFSSPSPIGRSQAVRLNFIPKVGTPTLVKFATPDLISTERVYLYP